MTNFKQLFDNLNNSIIYVFPNNFKIVWEIVGYEVKTFKDDIILNTVNFEKQDFSLNDLDNLVLAVDKLSNY